MLKRLALAAVLIAATSHAMAQQATLGGVTIKLPLPKGFCELSDQYPSDKNVRTLTSNVLEQGGNKLLGFSAQCKQLTDYRAGTQRLLDDYAQYQTSIALMDKVAPATVHETCDELRAEGSKILAKDEPDIKARMEAAAKNLKVQQTSFVGVLGEDTQACYAGVIQKMQTQIGSEKTQLSVFAVTIVKKRIIYLYRFTVYNGEDSVNRTLAAIKADVAALYAAN